MGGMVAAWAVGETIVIWRAWKVRKAPPMPGQLLATSALFVLLALLAESDQARPLKTEPSGPAAGGKPAPKVSTA